MQYRNNKIRVCAGVTLVEMIIAVAIMVIVFTAITPLFRGILNSWDSKAGAAETVQNGRVLIDHLKHNLSKAVRITDVSDSNVTTGYIEFEDNDGNTLRYDIAANYVEFGVVGDLNDLAGPVSTLQFTCYDANDFNTAITDGNDIRLVQVQTTLTNPAPLGADRTFTAQVYLRTNWETGSGTDLVGWWKLDETSGLTAVDSSGNSNDGTLTGTGLTWVTGYIDGALEFAGGTVDHSYVDADAVTGLTCDEVTVVWWMKSPVSVQPAAPLVTLVGSNNDYDLEINADGELVLYRCNSPGCEPLAGPTNQSVADNTWHHVGYTLSKSGNSCKIYYDGEPVSSDSFSDSESINSIRMGYRTVFQWAWYKGVLDDVRIYNCALSAAEVAQLANILRYREFTEAKAASDTASITISTPDTNEGDLLIAAVATDGDTSLSLADPGGWTEIYVDDNGTETTLGVWWKLAGASEPGTHEFDWTGDEQAYGWMMRVTGHDASGPIDDSAPDGESSSTPTSPAVTTTVSDALILRLGAFDDGDITEDDPGLSDHTAITMDKSGTGGGGGCDLADRSKGPPCEFEGIIAAYPALSQIDPNHYLLSYAGGANKDYGWASVLTVNTGTWVITEGTPELIDDAKLKIPALARIDSTHHLLAYGEVGTAVILTVNTETWLITKETPCVFGIAKGKTPALAQIDPTHFLLAYDENNTGTAVVLTVDTDAGTVTKETPFLEFSLVKGKNPALAQIDATRYLLAYEDNNLGHAVVLTVNTGNWVITQGEHCVYDGVKGLAPDLAQINSTHYLCAYSNTNGHGIAVVLTVNGETVTDETPYTYDTTEGKTPALAQIDSTNYLCAYDGGTGADGCAVVLTVDGAWGITKGTPFVYDSVLGETPALAQIDDCDYLCAYEGEGSDGYAVVLKFASSGGGGEGVVSGGAGYVKQSAAGDSGTSDFALTESEESQMLTIAIAPEPDSGGEILP